ncbi:dihydroorotate dehydrogenase (quinone), mitochondrial-like [Xenia sp. Carnegie-2017]|uniref:dihydroorotate dehydrogenase (quinone), mitochondrial-like n=1 Tax=Xenia sp. Carnegie-2017 TaxID=2897299 RepID=UPI001F047919|nr:dihydroorotate dehydrogenase (quinone), mitochondrial-like [Xenia sp. Carnegie-2017]
MSRSTRNVWRKLKYGILTCGGIASAVLVYGSFTGHELLYRSILMPAVAYIDPENAHTLAVKLAAHSLVPKDRSMPDKALESKLFGKIFPNPIGLAAGFDKHGECIEGMFKIGFGFVEIGSITPLAQPGNERPRVFRLKQDKAIINRYGFNSVGHDVVINRLTNEKRRVNQGVLGINLGKNKTSTCAAEDYVSGVKKFAPFADYLTINVSSPNTPGLRSLQGKKELRNLLEKVIKARDELTQSRPPILVKIAADLTPQAKEDIADVITKAPYKVDGVIVCNTTTSRPEDLRSQHKHETGGLSGEPLKKLATQTIREMYTLTKGELPIIGVGGVSNGRDAYEKIRAGASLVQIYSAIAYEGFPIVKKIKRELAELLRNDNIGSVSDAVGLDAGESNEKFL